MATLTVFKFNNPDGAGQMLEKVQALQKNQLIKVQDAAVVSWPQGRKLPRPSRWSTWQRWARWTVPSGACSSA